MQKLRDAILSAFMMANAAALAQPCTVHVRGGALAPDQHDHLYEHLTSAESCPKSAKQLRASIADTGLKLKPTMVANRGFHNPAAGSFSIFEMVAGTVDGVPLAPQDWIFGHFVELNGTSLDLIKGSGLLVEAIAWDQTKQLYNFYELIGLNNNEQTWFYRGDSADIFADLANMHLGDPQFGNTLRCSGCHMNGGPIMKELSEPNNDWWTQLRSLPFGEATPSPTLAAIMRDLVEPQQLSNAVKAGIRQLSDSTATRTPPKDLKHQLKPLFCPIEINIDSSQHTIANERDSLTIPTSFFIDPWWQSTTAVSISAAQYYNRLRQLGSKFPENGLLDADHAWLTPVRSWSDTHAVHQLVANQIVDEEFVADVLAVDFTSPLFSNDRCELLKLVPTSSLGWQAQFTKNLSHSDLPAAKQLHQHFTDPRLDKAHHQQEVDNFLQTCSAAQAIPDWLHMLGQIRQEVRQSVLSQHPGGQILEPNFRVIFPLWVQRGTKRLGANCLLRM